MTVTFLAEWQQKEQENRFPQCSGLRRGIVRTRSFETDPSLRNFGKNGRKCRHLVCRRCQRLYRRPEKHIDRIQQKFEIG